MFQPVRRRLEGQKRKGENRGSRMKRGKSPKKELLVKKTDALHDH